jgi:transposase
LHSLIDQVFPEYRGVFGSLYSKVSLLTLLAFPTSEAVLSISDRELTDKIASLCPSRSELWAKEKAQKLREAAIRNPFQKNLYQSHIFNLEILVKIVLQYQVHLSKIADEIDALAKEIEKYEILQSIPGIGEKIATTIISEIGEIDRFNGAKKFVAFYIWLFKVAFGMHVKRKRPMRSFPRNKKLREFYDKKQEEGKPFRVAIIACVNKLLHWIYAILKSKSTFQDIA